MKLDQLRYFTKVVEIGSLNQAAQNLYITQPALSASIHGLEAELQVPLLHRTNRGVFPTEYGKIVYQDCVDHFEAIEQHMVSWKQFSQDRQRTTGIVHISAIPVACNFIMENLIWGLQQEYPNITVILHEVRMLNFASNMLKADYHIGITAVSPGQIESATQQYQQLHLNYQPLMEDEYCAFCSSQSPLMQKDALTLEDCKELEIITYSQTDNQNFSKEFFQPKRLYNLNSLGNILQAIAENQGCGIFLNRMLKNNWFIKNGYIHTKPLIGDAKHLSEHHLIWAPDAYLSGAEKIVIDYIRKNYATFYGPNA